MDETGKDKAYAMQAGYIAVTVLLFVFYMILVITLANSGFGPEQVMFGSIIGLAFLTLVLYGIYRATLRNIHRKHLLLS